MTYATQRLSYAAIITISALSAAVAHADDQLDRYLVTNLVSDIAGIALNTDPVLQNAWGVAFTPAASPFWVADNATGCSTLYDGAGAKVNLQVKIPLPGNSIPASACKHVDPAHPPSPSPAAPTGMAWNPSPTFLVPGTSLPASFIFATEEGKI
jgi:hypothetical protein